MSSIFLAINRNKRSLAVNTKTEEGKDVIRRLIPTVDVFVTTCACRRSARLRLCRGGESARHRVLRGDRLRAGWSGQGSAGVRRHHQSASGLWGNCANLGVAQYAPSLLADKTIGVFRQCRDGRHRASPAHGQGQSIERCRY
jgi:formyl-CoA transferase